MKLALVTMTVRRQEPLGLPLGLCLTI